MGVGGVVGPQTDHARWPGSPPVNGTGGTETGGEEERMIQVIKSEDRYHADMGWLSTYWHFSFDTYYDPSNMNWGALRVFNDDVVQPGQGFGMHPHKDMEIITYVLDGELEHRDHLGNRGLARGGPARGEEAVPPRRPGRPAAAGGLVRRRAGHAGDRPGRDGLR